MSFSPLHHFYRALAPFAEAFEEHSDPGTSDLYDEQPMSIHVTLGAWREALRLCREYERSQKPNA